MFYFIYIISKWFNFFSVSLIYLPTWSETKETSETITLLILGLIPHYRQRKAHFQSLWQAGCLQISHDKFSVFICFHFFAPAYGVYVSQLIRYARACSEYQDYLNEEDCSLWDCWLRNTKELNWCQHLRSSMGGIMTLSITTMWQFQDLYLIYLPQPSHKLSKPRILVPVFI